MNTLSEYGISATSSNHAESETSTQELFRPSKVAMFGLALITTSLHLSDIQPAQLIDRFTAKSLVEPFAKDQLINTQRQDIKMITRVRELASYKMGWDGFDGRPPSKEAVDEAEKFIISLSKYNISEPSISLASDGEINFYWKNNDFLLDLGFFGEGVYSYYAKKSSGEEYIQDDIKIDAPLPKTIIKLITK
jgi:hypothetical protein